MKKLTLLICLVLAIVFHANAKIEKGSESHKTSIESATAAYSLKGTVYDPVNNETVTGAIITVDGVKYYSDFDGNFSVAGLKKGKHQVSVDFISYQSQELEVDVDTDKELVIEIKQ